MRTRPFRLLVIAFTAHGAAVATASVLLITYLVHLGHTPASPPASPAQLTGYGPVMTTVATACVIAAFALPAYHRV
ncbi:hypothetical protein AB0J63_43350 [Streptosporangium canum]|uniref:hypothetical protein n=1 Tax=Streptosporangium canum TaxID=324952 RepID=UPI00343A7423